MNSNLVAAALPGSLDRRILTQEIDYLALPRSNLPAEPLNITPGNGPQPAPRMAKNDLGAPDDLIGIRMTAKKGASQEVEKRRIGQAEQ